VVAKYLISEILIDSDFGVTFMSKSDNSEAGLIFYFKESVEVDNIPALSLPRIAPNINGYKRLKALDE
jgi:hypothetical protein